MPARATKEAKAIMEMKEITDQQVQEVNMVAKAIMAAGIQAAATSNTIIQAVTAARAAMAKTNTVITMTKEAITEMKKTRTAATTFSHA